MNRRKGICENRPCVTYWLLKIFYLICIIFFLIDLTGCSNYSNPEIMIAVSIHNIIEYKTNNQITFDVHCENTGNINIDSCNISYNIYKGTNYYSGKGMGFGAYFCPKTTLIYNKTAAVNNPTNINIQISRIQVNNYYFSKEYIWEE